MNTRLGSFCAGTIFLSTAFIFSCSELAPNPQAAPVSAPSIVLNYHRDLKQINSARFNVPNVGFNNCGSSLDSLPVGKDTPTNLLIFMNSQAEAAFYSKKTYPAGSIIVKEKNIGTMATAVGGMIKRWPGFDPDHGDWEFFYAPLNTMPSRPAIIHIDNVNVTNCIQCHNSVAENDHVFGNWNDRDNNYHLNNQR